MTRRFWQREKPTGICADYSGDVAPLHLDVGSWDGASAEAALQALHEHVTRRSQQVICWYIANKAKKKRWALFLRLSAIILLGVSGVIPVLAQIAEADDWFTLQPAWATVALAVAGTLVLLDKFFGFSTAWARFISAELELQADLDAFRLEWQRTIATGDPATRIADLTTMAVDFMNEVSRVLRAETAQWVSEFQESIRTMEESLRQQRAS